MVRALTLEGNLGAPRVGLRGALVSTHFPGAQGQS